MKLTQDLFANRLIMSDLENTATFRGRSLENQESQMGLMLLTTTMKESSMQQLLHQSQYTLKTTSNQSQGHISLVTTTKKLKELLRIASKLANLKKVLSANRLIMSPTEEQITATFQRKQSENQESPKETMVPTHTTKESSMQQ